MIGSTWRQEMALLIFLVLLFSIETQHIPVNVNQNEWKGIIPLLRKKNEVEKILGKPVTQTDGIVTYKTDTEDVTVSYSTGNCKGAITGWNVPADTVLQFTVFPKKELRIERDKFKNETIFYFATNSFVLPEKGVAYSLDYGVDNGQIDLNIVRYMRFVPKQSDSKLRCKEFPEYNPVGAMYSPDYILSEENSLSGLDVLITESLNRFPEAVSYAVVYGVRDQSENDYNKVFDFYQAHVYEKRKASRQKVRLVKGGLRKLFSVEVFNLTTDRPPPVPSPEFPLN